ncbi:MAG: hypothetical protein HKN21_13560, partial [Candidatus Eisenbacteria bacterium]|nr:hypothetical protein [Candidatus Eisenbacteria bacterium]
MMATLITWSRRALFSALFGLTISSAGTVYAEVYPVRSPMAELGYEPWPGFRLPRQAAFGSLQNSFSPDFGRTPDPGWVPWLSTDPDTSEAQTSPLQNAPATLELHSAWSTALEAARNLDLDGTDRA